MLAVCTSIASASASEDAIEKRDSEEGLPPTIEGGSSGRGHSGGPEKVELSVGGCEAIELGSKWDCRRWLSGEGRCDLAEEESGGLRSIGSAGPGAPKPRTTVLASPRCTHEEHGGFPSSTAAGWTARPDVFALRDKRRSSAPPGAA
jgi:hypothetical protein